MLKKNILLFVFFSFFSYGYSQVNYTLDYTEVIYREAGGHTVTIYRPQIKITRISENEDVNISINRIKLYSINGNDYLDLKLYLNPSLEYNKYLTLNKLTLTGGSFTASNLDHNPISVINTWSSNPHKEMTGDFNIAIPRKTPDFGRTSIGDLVFPNGARFNRGEISLVTLHPLTVNIPDIDFGDILVTSGTLTKSGQITVTGSANTKVSFDIPVHDFKLYKRGSSNGVSASADIDGRILKHEDAIRSNGNLTKNLNVTISNFSTLPPGRYEGDLLININSN